MLTKRESRKARTAASATLPARCCHGFQERKRILERPKKPRKRHQSSPRSRRCSQTALTLSPGLTSGALRRPFPEQALRAEDEDQDQDREDQRVGPVGAGRVPLEAVVELLDQPDADRAEHGTREVPDPAEDVRGEGEQAQAESRVELHVGDEKRVEDAREARQEA